MKNEDEECSNVSSLSLSFSVLLGPWQPYVQEATDILEVVYKHFQANTHLGVRVVKVRRNIVALGTFAVSFLFPSGAFPLLCFALLCFPSCILTFFFFLLRAACIRTLWTSTK